MSLKTVTTIAEHELLVNIRNKWTITFAFVFGLLVLAISYFGLRTLGYARMEDFSRTVASLLNLVLYIIPLVALVMGTMSFTGNREFAELLFAQPVSRLEVLLGKTAGLFGSLLLSTLIGFGLAGVLIGLRTGLAGTLRYFAFVGLSLVLALIFLGVAILVTILLRRKSKSFGVVLFVWFFFVILYDLLVMGGAGVIAGKTARWLLFLSVFGNPVDMVRISGLMTVNGSAVFGPAGAALVRFLGGYLGAALSLTLALLAWTALPLLFASRSLRCQDV